MVQVHPDLYVSANTFSLALNKLAEIYIAGKIIAYYSASKGALAEQCTRDLLLESRSRRRELLVLRLQETKVCPSILEQHLH